MGLIKTIIKIKLAVLAVLVLLVILAIAKKKCSLCRSLMKGGE